MTFEKIRHVELAIALIAVFAMTLYFSKPGITGFVSTESHYQALDLDVDHSGTYVLKSSTGAPITLTSFSLSGSVQGTGTANVYLNNGKGTKLKIWSNTKPKSSGLGEITGVSNKITGAVVKEGEPTPASILEVVPGKQLYEYEDIPEGYTPVSGPFKQECLETCLLPEDLFTNAQYELIVKLEPGTTLLIEELVYTTKEE